MKTDWTPPPVPERHPVAASVKPPQSSWVPPPFEPKSDDVPKALGNSKKTLKTLFVCIGAIAVLSTAFVIINRHTDTEKAIEANSSVASASEGQSGDVGNGTKRNLRIPMEQGPVEGGNLSKTGADCPALFSCPDSIYHVYLENQDRAGQDSPFLTIKRDDKVIYRGLFTAGIKRTLWSPDKRHVAIEEDPESPGDLVWIIELTTGKLIKKPYDERSKRMAEHLQTTALSSAVKNWGPDVVSEGSEVIVEEWIDSSTVALRVKHFFLSPPKFDAFHTVSHRHLWSTDEQSPELAMRKQENRMPDEDASGRQTTEQAIVHSWTQIDSPRLHHSQVFSVDRANDHVSFGVCQMERFGALMQHASVADLDWDRARVIGNVKGGAFAGGTKIGIPMKPGSSPRVMTWSVDPGYSVESPPWVEGVSPAREEKSGSEIWLIAANPRAATEFVALVKKFRVRNGIGTGEPAFEQAGGFPGERYPQTRTGLINPAEFSRLGSEELRYAINEIFARRGALFGNQEVLAAFEGFEWYRPIVTENLEGIEARLSNNEKENLKILGGLRAQKR